MSTDWFMAEYWLINLTKFELEVQFVGFGLERSWELYPHLKRLPSADNEVIAVVMLCVMIHTVFTFFGLDEVYGLHW